MPRVCGGSGSSAMGPIRLSPSPIRVSRWVWWRRMGLPICWILMTLFVPLILGSRLSPRIGSVGDLLGVALAPARLQRRHLDIAACRDRARRILALEGVEGRAHHVVGIGGSDRF